MSEPRPKIKATRSKRSLEADLLQSVREMKAGLRGRVHRPNLSELARVRSTAGLTQSEFAALLGVSLRTLQDWEQGRRSPSGAAKTLIKVAERHPEVLHDLTSYSAREP